jgi:hypothetical protein
MIMAKTIADQMIETRAGGLAVCAGSCGPGNLHLINGLFDCHRSRVPVLAIGAKAAFPQRLVISLSGDLLTLNQLNLPVKVVVFNNGALGFIELDQKSSGFLDTGTDLVNPKFAAMAETAGIKGVDVSGDPAAQPHEPCPRPRMALCHQDLRRGDAGLGHRLRRQSRSTLLGDGNSLHHVTIVRRHDPIEGRLSPDGHLARRDGGSRAGAEPGERSAPLTLSLALLDRTPSSYVFILAGYTAAIIGFPSVDTPGDIWPTALARTEEISLGIVCATLVSSVVFPRHIAPMILERTESWLRDGHLWAEDVLRERALTTAGAADRARLAADLIDIGVLATQLRYDLGFQSVSTRAVDALHARLLMLLPLLASIASRLSALRRVGSLRPALSEVLADTTGFVAHDDNSQAYGRLTASIAELQAEADRSALWSDILQAGLLLRLRELVTLFHDCRMLQIHLRAGRTGLPAVAGGMEIEAAPLQHRDVGMALFQASRQVWQSHFSAPIGSQLPGRTARSK